MISSPDSKKSHMTKNISSKDLASGILLKGHLEKKYIIKHYNSVTVTHDTITNKFEKCIFPINNISHLSRRSLSPAHSWWSGMCDCWYEGYQEETGGGPKVEIMTWMTFLIILSRDMRQ